MFELPSLEYGGAIETPTSFEISVSLRTRAASCPTCGGSVESKGRAQQMEVWDTPMGGKHVRYQFTGRRFQCAKCKTFTDRGPDIHPAHGVTWRLWHYVRRMALKHSINEIERFTGATQDQLWPIASALADTLVRHKFDTPRIVAVDDIRFGKKRRFTVIYDGETGYPLSIVEKLDAKGVGVALHNVIEPKKAEIFVSDMNGSNLRLGKSSFSGIPHVADKWHVLDKMQKQISRVVNQTANKLRKGPAAELKSWKMEFEGKFAAKDAKLRKAMLAGEPVEPRQRKEDQGVLALRTKWDILKTYPQVRIVYHARLLLRHVYRANSRHQAEHRFDRFLDHGCRVDMPKEAANAIKLLGEHRQQILAYFDVMWQHHDGRYRGPTTSQAEARNAKIKAMWKRSKGIRDANYLNMRVVFEPYVLGVTLVLCEECGKSEVLSEAQGLLRAGLDMRGHQAGCCSVCANGLIRNTVAA